MDGAILKHRVSATDWLILMKPGMVMQFELTLLILPVDNISNS